MRKACAFRRSWSRLHRVSGLGQGDGTGRLRHPQIALVLGDKFISKSAIEPPSPCTEPTSGNHGEGSLALSAGPGLEIERGGVSELFGSTIQKCFDTFGRQPGHGSSPSSFGGPESYANSSFVHRQRGRSGSWKGFSSSRAHALFGQAAQEESAKFVSLGLDGPGILFDLADKDGSGKSLGWHRIAPFDGLRVRGGGRSWVEVGPQHEWAICPKPRESGDRRNLTSPNEMEAVNCCSAGALGRSAFPISAGPSGRFYREARLCNSITLSQYRPYSSGGAPPTKSETTAEPEARDYSQRAVVTALWCNFLVFSLKIGVWLMTSSHVMLAEAIHSLADLANQGLLAYGLMSSKRAPDAMHPYGYSKERFVWSLISAVGIFCLGSGATIIYGVQNLFTAEPLVNVYLAALVISGSMIMEGASLAVAISCVRNGAKAEGMTMRDYLWRGHDPTTVAVMMEDGAAVAGLVIAAAALAAANYTGNPIWDPIGSIIVGNLLGGVAIFLIQRNRHALLGRSMDDQDMIRVMNLLSKDPVVDAIYDCKSEVIGPGAYRFKAEIDFNGVVIVQNYLKRAGRETWHKEFQEAVNSPEAGHLDRVLAIYGEEVVSALGSEVDRLEKEIQRVVPGIRHVDIEAHNPQGPAPREKLYLY